MTSLQNLVFILVKYSDILVIIATCIVLLNIVLTCSKSPFAPSYIIDLSKMEEKIHNIIDIQFLQGYYEPTLFILYEPIRTWAGYVISNL